MAQRPTVAIDETFAPPRKGGVEPDTPRHSHSPSFHLSRNHLRRGTSSGPHHLVSGGVVSKTLSLTSLRRGCRGLAQARVSRWPGPPQAARWLKFSIQFQLVNRRPVEEDCIAIRLISRLVSDQQVGVQPPLAQGNQRCLSRGTPHRRVQLQGRGHVEPPGLHAVPFSTAVLAASRLVMQRERGRRGAGPSRLARAQCPPMFVSPGRSLAMLLRPA